MIHHWSFYMRINTQICSAESQGLLKVNYGTCKNRIRPYPLDKTDDGSPLFPYGDDYE